LLKYVNEREMIGQGLKHGIGIAIKYLTLPLIITGIISGSTLLVKYGERKAEKANTMENFNNNLIKLSIKVDTLSNQVYTVSNNVEDIKDTLLSIRKDQSYLKNEVNVINITTTKIIDNYPDNKTMQEFRDALIRFQGASYNEPFPIIKDKTNISTEDTLKKKQIYVVSSFQ
jgi:hypothetical protein